MGTAVQTREKRLMAFAAQERNEADMVAAAEAFIAAEGITTSETGKQWQNAVDKALVYLPPRAFLECANLLAVWVALEEKFHNTTWADEAKGTGAGLPPWLEEKV